MWAAWPRTWTAERRLVVLPSPALGRAETSRAARREGPQAGGWSCLLSCAFLSLASSPGGPAHSSSSNLTQSWSKALLGTLGPSRRPGWACSYRVVGKIWTNSTTLSPPVATWLTLKRQGQIRIAVPFGAGMAGRGQKGVFSFLIWVQVSDEGYKNSLSFMTCALCGLYMDWVIVLP